MKATGIVRRVDGLGRVVIPKETRRTLGIEDGKTYLEMYTGDNGEVMFKKYEPGCGFCGETDDLVEYQGQLICQKCKDEIANL